MTRVSTASTVGMRAVIATAPPSDDVTCVPPAGPLMTWMGAVIAGASTSISAMPVMLYGVTLLIWSVTPGPPSSVTFVNTIGVRKPSPVVVVSNAVSKSWFVTANCAIEP